MSGDPRPLAGGGHRVTLTEAIENTAESLQQAIGTAAVVLTDQRSISATLADGHPVVMVPPPSVTWEGWELRAYTFDLWVIAAEPYDAFDATAALSRLLDLLDAHGLDRAEPATYQDSGTAYPMYRVTYTL